STISSRSPSIASTSLNRFTTISKASRLCCPITAFGAQTRFSTPIIGSIPYLLEQVLFTSGQDLF
ncbi:hypothetical protein, partial [Bacillus proteolyticus]|uniref:hypothetical protein n=1 Tax=Bacillus proteolyticus TaxID=2026192 RepID=UPI001ABFA520